MEEKSTLPFTTQRKQALVIGTALLLMAIVAAFSAPTTAAMLVSGNPELTVQNIHSHLSQYTIAVFGWLLIFLLDVLVSLAIYRYYNNVKKKTAFYTAAFRLLYSAFLLASLIWLFSTIGSNNDSFTYRALKMFNRIWGWGLIAFGLHLILLGMLFGNQGGKLWVNRSIKALLIVAGIGYMVQYTGILLVNNPASFAAIVQPLFLAPMVLSEIAFAIWMLAKGGKQK